MGYLNAISPTGQGNGLLIIEGRLLLFLIVVEVLLVLEVVVVDLVVVQLILFLEAVLLVLRVGGGLWVLNYVC